MKKMSLPFLTILLLNAFTSCSQNESKNELMLSKTKDLEKQEVKQVAHEFGGWYCPDNLNGFPPVNYSAWDKVPVISDRLPTKAESRSEASLIYVDTAQFPKASALQIALPQLATFISPYTKREELIIVIQAIAIGKDSLLGFRYLNGGNGSARINEVEFIHPRAVELPLTARFVIKEVTIDAQSKAIWERMLKAEQSSKLIPQNSKDWPKSSLVDFPKLTEAKLSNAYANLLFGNYYAQNDYESNYYSEKFLLLENEDSPTTVLKVVCGPFTEDYAEKERKINQWIQQLKKQSEDSK